MYSSGTSPVHVFISFTKYTCVTVKYPNLGSVFCVMMSTSIKMGLSPLQIWDCCRWDILETVRVKTGSFHPVSLGGLLF